VLKMIYVMNIMNEQYENQVNLRKAHYQHLNSTLANATHSNFTLPANLTNQALNVTLPFQPQEGQREGA